MDIRVLVGDPVDPATLYAGGDAGLFQSVDRGSWSQRATFQVTCCTWPPGTAPSPTSPFPQLAPAGVRSLLIDFTNPNILYAWTARINGCFFADALDRKFALMADLDTETTRALGQFLIELADRAEARQG